MLLSYKEEIQTYSGSYEEKTSRILDQCIDLELKMIKIKKSKKAYFISIAYIFD